MRVYHFNNGSGGGVLSVIKNLIEHSVNPEVENHIIYTINKDKTPEFVIPEIKKTASIQVFYFSPKWNFWYTCRQLAKLIPDDKAVLVAHDWLELGMASHLGLQNPVVQFLHGDFEYYYDVAFKHQNAIDYFICVSPVIIEHLKTKLIERKGSIYLRNFPVPEIHHEREKNNEGGLRMFYCVRDLNEERKQFKILPEINSLLEEKNINVNWTIVGLGKSEVEIKKLLGSKAIYHGKIPNEKVLELLKNQDLFLLPSLEEGLPVALVEAMKGGLIPLITNWNGATFDLVVEGETGFYFKADDSQGYAERIAFLCQNRSLLEEISARAKQKAESLFDPFRNTGAIEDIYRHAVEEKMTKNPKKVYGSRLDKVWMPNFFTTLMRKSFSLLS